MTTGPGATNVITPVAGLDRFRSNASAVRAGKEAGLSR